MELKSIFTLAQKKECQVERMMGIAKTRSRTTCKYFFTERLEYHQNPTYVVQTTVALTRSKPRKSGFCQQGICQAKFSKEQMESFQYNLRRWYPTFISPQFH